MAKVQTVCLVVLILGTAMMHCVRADHTNVLKWRDNVIGGKPKYTLACQMDEPFHDKEKKECAFSVKLGEKKDEDATIEISCGEDPKCSYTGKPTECKAFKRQSQQIKFNEGLIKQLTKESACEAAELKGIKPCKNVVFKKAEMEYF